MAFKRKDYHKEENCLNCGVPLIGKFCANCGQKAFFHKDKFWHMVAHFAGDYFHYDSKCWVTVKTLFTKPGLATLEYIQGKRAKFLNPIQLYFFVTTIFFLIMFSLGKTDTKTAKNTKINKDSIALGAVKYKETQQKDTTSNFSIIIPEISSVQYDSIQNTLPASKKDNRFIHYFAKRYYQVLENKTDNFNEIFMEKFIHAIPKLFFILLPVFAFFLHLIFYKRKLFYVDHIIFSLHFHTVLFLVYGAGLLLSRIIKNDIFYSIINLAIVIYIAIYLFLALKKVYPSHTFKLILKQFSLFIFYLISFAISIVALLLITFFIM